MWRFWSPHVILAFVAVILSSALSQLIKKGSLVVVLTLWRHKNEYPGGIFWISGENNGVFQSSVREMALEMQIKTMESDFSFT